jgi:hypothetical protein
VRGVVAGRHNWVTPKTSVNTDLDSSEPVPQYLVKDILHTPPPASGSGGWDGAERYRVDSAAGRRVDYYATSI